MTDKIIIGIVGNPNCGKSTLFNIITGAKQQVGNWPGVTVERKEGICRIQNQEIIFVDLPGVYTLAAQSPDELVARNFILSKEYTLILNIIDAANIERNLYLTTQLTEMQIPLVLVLNMMDVAQQRNIIIDMQTLSVDLNCPVIPVIAKQPKSVAEFLNQLGKILLAFDNSLPTQPPLPPILEAAVIDLQASLKTEIAAHNLKINARWLALKLIENDGGASLAFWQPVIDEQAQHWRNILEEKTGDESDILIADIRYHFIGQLLYSAVRQRGEISHSLTEKLDHWLLNRILGIPIFLGVLYLMFMFTINLGGAFIDFFDILVGGLFVDGTHELLTQIHSPAWLITLLADGLGGGIQTLSTFIPPIGFMFLFLSWLEDSGYMARAAFILDRFLRFIGLPGKAFIPMMVGFGCNVPAILGTRTLENKRDRIITIMMNPFMSCGARMPVYALFMAAFFPQGGQNIVFSLYLTGVIFAILTGLILRHTLLKGDVSKFVMELPLYHLPSIRVVIFHAWDRLKGFIIRAGKLLIPVIMILSFFNSLGSDGSFGNANTEKSILSIFSRQVTPLFAPMGISEENWPATVGLFIGIFAKEGIVGTLDAMYNQINVSDQQLQQRRPAFNLKNKIHEAVTATSNNLLQLGKVVLDPLKLSLNLEENNNSKNVTFVVMNRLFNGRSGAIAYLIFVLLYFPCVAATSAIYQEINLRWALFAGLWTTTIAWSAATGFYQSVNFARHPDVSMFWLFIIAGFWLLTILCFKYLTQAPFQKN